MLNLILSIRSIFVCGKASRFGLLAIFLTFQVIFASGASLAGQSIWSYLDSNKDNLEIMDIQATSDGVIFFGAKYADELPRLPPLSAEQMSDDQISEEQLSGQVLRKLLHVIKVDSNEEISWQHLYSAIPDNHEIYSASTMSSHGSCLIYGELKEENEVSDPVLVQLDNHGKIAWVKRAVISSRIAENSDNEVLESIANLDSIGIAGIDSDTCVMVYVSRVTSKSSTEYELHLVGHGVDGRQKWHNKVPVNLYGKLMLIIDRNRKRFFIIITNRSRDAAIEAMLSATPFSPRTAFYKFNYEGKLLEKNQEPTFLESVWVNSAVLNENGSLLLVGKKSGSWAALVSPAFKLKTLYENGTSEITAVSISNQNNEKNDYLFADQDKLMLINNDLKFVKSQPLSSGITRSYINIFINDRLPENIPVQRIIPVSKKHYLILFQLGARITEMKFENRKSK